MLALLQEPEANLVGVEQRAGPVGNVVEHDAEVQLAGQLLGDVPQRLGASDLAPGADQGARALDIRRDGACRHLQEGGGHRIERSAGIALHDERADRLAPCSQDQLPTHRSGGIVLFQ